MKSSISKKRQKHKIKLYAKKAVWTVKLLKFLVPIFIILFLLNVVFTETNFFHIKKIEVLGATQFVNKKDFYEVAKASLMGKNINTIDLSMVTTDLLNQFQGAKDIKIIKRYPSSVKIEIQERTALAVLNNQDNHYLVDDEGYVLGLVDETTTNLPEVDYTAEVKVGYFIDENLIPVYLELINSIDETELKVSSISTTNGQVVFYLNDSIKVLLSTKKPITKTIEVLAELHEQLVNEGKVARRIDLRYDKVIVSY